jgi:hypothetical protein
MKPKVHSSSSGFPQETHSRARRKRRVHDVNEEHVVDRG